MILTPSEQLLRQPRQTQTRPSVIIVHTEIGYGCPAKQGKASAHGEPLGGDNVLALKENIGWESMEPFFVPQDVYDHMETVKSV